MAFKKVEKFGSAVSFLNPGDCAEGLLQGKTTGTTQFGEAEFLQIVDDNGETQSVCISSNLAGYNWQDMMGMYVRITYTGNEKNPATKRTFKVYDVEVDEPEE